MQLTINGRRATVSAQPGSSLLEVLRGELGLRSPKDGCSPEGSCGACTVLLDGRPMVSCSVPAERAAERTVETLEGLDRDVRAAWANAFVQAGATQCGFCTPGIVMKAEGLLRRIPDPSPPEVARALAGNLCRCTGYAKVIEAIRHVARARRGESLPGPGGGRVGERALRYRGRAQVLGEQSFVADLAIPGMLHGALRFADHPRAVVRRIDVRPAAAMPGVRGIVTWRDVPGRRTVGLLTADWPPFVAEGETTRYVGDVLAAVAADTRTQAREAAARVSVEYEVLPPLTDPVAALAPDAHRLHPGGNLLSVSRVHRGDASAAFEAAAHVVSGTFQTQRIEHAFLEPEAALAVPEPPGMHLFSPGQGAWEDRRQLAAFLGVPEAQVRVSGVAAGGAFGGKEDLGVQPHAALLARMVNAPVLVSLSRAESLRFHPKRHPMTLEYAIGADADGRLTAVRARITGDTGAYASVGAKVLERAAGHACGPYRVPNVDVEARAVYTNNPPCGAMRGFGVPQASFALEGLLDELAERVGVDGWEIRWRNALSDGDRFGTGQLLTGGVGIRDTLLAVREAYRSARFAGIACAAKNTGIGNGIEEHGRAILRPERDGTVTLFHSWSEMGQGVHTVLRQVAAQELGIPPERVHVRVDTERELDTGETTASRATVLGGRAVLDAARSLRRALGERQPEELAGEEFSGDYAVTWTTPLGESDEPVTHLSYGWATQVVILDEEGRLERVVAAQDVGHALNPLAIEGQVEGGVHMGLGYALTESFDTDGGVPVAQGLKELGIIPAAGMPAVEAIIVEYPQPEGPYGAKGAGETVLVPTAAAVAGALYAFDGIRRRSLPMRDSPAARAAVPRLARRSERARNPSERMPVEVES